MVPGFGDHKGNAWSSDFKARNADNAFACCPALMWLIATVTMELHLLICLPCNTKTKWLLLAYAVSRTDDARSTGTFLHPSISAGMLTSIIGWGNYGGGVEKNVIDDKIFLASGVCNRRYARTHVAVGSVKQPTSHARLNPQKSDVYRKTHTLLIFVHAHTRFWTVDISHAFQPSIPFLLHFTNILYITRK